MALSHDACTGGDGAMSNHFLKMVLDDGFQGPHVEFECKADRFAECRRRPVDKQQESWGPDDELDGGGHVCWIAEWIEAVDMSECFPADPDVPEVVAEVPITVGYDEGPIILSVGAYGTYGPPAITVSDAASIARRRTRASVELVERCERCGCDLRYPTASHVVDCGTRKEQD